MASGKRPVNQTTKKKSVPKKRRYRLKRFLLTLFIFFSVVFIAGALTTYKVVSAYLADVPDFDPAVLIPAETSYVYDRYGTEVTGLLGEINRVTVPYEEIPKKIINAFIAIEDDRFFEHSGFDPRGIMRAAYRQLTGRVALGSEGGSTITQQLVKMTFLTPEKTIKRKVQEVYLAWKVERIYTKEEILEFYLNRVPYDFNASGIEAAAQTFFGKTIADVTLGEAAILAGVPNLPARYSPFRNEAESIKRRNIILNRMHELGMISAEELEEAKNEELVLAGRPVRAYPYPHFIDHIIHDEMHKILRTIPQYKDYTSREIYDVIYQGGLKIYTTLDQRLQQVSEDTIDNAKLYPRTIAEEGKPLQPQAAVVVADPKTGHIKAMVGGREYGSDNVINRATRGKSQAGSVLKPLVAYGPAFSEGIAVPGTVIDDAPAIWHFTGSPSWYPNNYDRTFTGLVTARVALARSLNIPAARLLDRLGLNKGLEYLEKMGITTVIYPAPGREKHDSLSIVLGGLTDGLKAFDAAQAYAVLANQGVRTDLVAVLKIEDRNGRVIYEHRPRSTVVMSREAAWLTTSVLQDAVRIGTVKGLQIGRPVAAKTGTSDKNRDAWLAAYTPDLVAVFWIGRDSYKPEEDGGLRAWIVTPGFMNPILKAAHEGLPVRDFTRPDTISPPVAICNKSGKRPGPLCPPEHIVQDFFLRDNIPVDTCDIHVEIAVCIESGKLPTEFCPPGSVKNKFFFNRPPFLTTDDNWAGPIGRVPADAGLMPPAEYCDLHTARPPAPTGLTADYRLYGYLLLRWHPGDETTVGYLVYRRAPGEESYVLLTEQPLSVPSFEDTSLVDSGKYSYRVYNVTAGGTRSAPASITIQIGPGTPEDREHPGQGNSGNNRRND
jgi:penicillin-binding protein 1A